jgi:ribosomal protein S18 acetylase RimI-like enzyme
MPFMLDRPNELEGLRWVAVALTPGDAPALQAFLDANPLYAQLAYGRPWLPGDAVRELSDGPPADWPQGPSHWWAVLERDGGRWLGLITFTEDLLAAGVWNLGFLVVATREQGSGLARELHDAWAAHAERSGARWLRLGVITTNERAVAFWDRLGYVEVRQRHQVKYGDRVHSISVRIRPLAGATIGQHLAQVERDRPGST